MKRALITGITGQDGAYLAQFLLKKGYEVHGVKRRASSFNTERVDPICRDPRESGVRFFMHYGDLTDATNLIRSIQEIQPAEIYGLWAQSHVQVSFETPEYTANADAPGVLRILEPFEYCALKTRPDSTRLPHPRCSVGFGRFPGRKPRRFTPVVLRGRQALRLQRSHGLNA